MILQQFYTFKICICCDRILAEEDEHIRQRINRGGGADRANAAAPAPRQRGHRQYQQLPPAEDKWAPNRQNPPPAGVMEPIQPVHPMFRYGHHHWEEIALIYAGKFDNSSNLENKIWYNGLEFDVLFHTQQ